MNLWRKSDVLLRFSSPSVSPLRSLTTTVPLCKQKKPRLKLTSFGSLSTNKSNSAVSAARASTMREQWEKKQKKFELLGGKKPNHEVFFTKFYPPQCHSLDDIVTWHREYVASPEMLASPSATLWAQFTLNCRTKKKTRFLHQLPLVFLLHKPLDFLPEKNVLAFCSEAEDISAALQAGALDAGGKELISKIEHGFYNYEAFDYVVCHQDMLSAVSKLRVTLRDKMPAAKSDRVGTDMGKLVKLFKNGVILDINKNEAVPEVGTIKVVLGSLDWAMEDIRANFEQYAHAIQKGGQDRVLGTFIENVEVSCPPSDEIFYVNMDFLGVVEDTAEVSNEAEEAPAEDVEALEKAE